MFRPLPSSGLCYCDARKWFVEVSLTQLRQREAQKHFLGLALSVHVCVCVYWKISLKHSQVMQDMSAAVAFVCPARSITAKATS